MKYTHSSLASGFVAGYRIVRKTGGITCAAMLGAALAMGGCQHQTRPPEVVGPVPSQSFIRDWSASLELKNDPLRHVYLRGDTIYAYSQSNMVYAFTAAGGKLLYADQVMRPGGVLRPPIVLPQNKIAFPAGDTIEVYDRGGRRLQSIKLSHPTRGPGVAVGNILYIGIDSDTGGRLTSLDLTMRPPTAEQVETAKKLKIVLDAQTTRIVMKWEVLTGGGIEGAPVFYQGVCYAAATDGKIWAVNEQGSGIWSLPNGDNVFKADGPIFGDLKVDEVGVYAASQDGKLYCVDRGTGRIKWTYFAGAPMDSSPVVTGNTVYQYAPGAGLAAVDKLSKGVARAKWVNDRAVRYLADDEKYVYAEQADGYLAALDKETGVTAFRSSRDGLTLFAQNFKENTIYAAAEDGRILSIKPVLRPGVTGMLVLDTTPRPFEMFAMR